MLVRLVRLGAPLLALAASLLSWPFVPEPMPIHWGLDGQPDGFAPRALGLLLLPVAALVLPALIGWLAARDPKLGRGARQALDTTLAGTAAFLAAVHGLALVAAAGSGTLSIPWVTALLGVLFLAIGAAMHDLEPNGWIGVRTTATLRDPAVWKAVHEKTAPAFAGVGALAILAALVLPASAALGLTIAAALAVGLGSTVFAWSLGRARS